MTRIRLYLRVIFWSCLLFFLLIFYDPEKVIRLIGAKRPGTGDSMDKTPIIKCIRSVCRKNPLARRRPCLHKSLLLYRFLHYAGYFPVINIGFAIRNLSQSQKNAIGNVHAWVTINGQAVLDDTMNGNIRYPYFLWTVSNMCFWASLEPRTDSRSKVSGR